MNEIELYNFTDLSISEKEMILEWRNHPEIRKWMYTDSVIDLENHMNFISNLKNDLNKLYFLVKKDDEYLGVIDFYNFMENDYSEYGFYANPNSKIPGIGRLLEEISIDYAFNKLKVSKLKLEVFEDNKQVRNLHKKYKFLDVSEKIINDKKVICMELTNENR